MATFPTIYRRGTEIHNPVVGDFDDTMVHDPAIRSQSEGGYVTSRARFTRTQGKWTIRYDWMSQANKDTLKTFIAARSAGAGEFTWTNPEDDTAYTVRFLGLVKYTAHSNTNFLWWIVEFILEEV